MKISQKCCHLLRTSFFKTSILKVLTVIVLGILITTKLFYRNIQPKDHNCLADPPNCENFDGIQLLSVKHVELTPNSIFFLEDHHHNFISPRVLCTVESASITNPEKSVFLLTTSPEIYHTPALLNVLEKYNNIHFGYIDPTILFNDTPLFNWFRNQRWKESQWSTYHFSDAIRWVMLWVYGGVYLDTDVISIRKLPNSSFVALESNVSLGAGAIGLPAKHELLRSCILDIATTYNPNIWGNIGPDLLTRALIYICGDEALKPSKICLDVRVLQTKSFYPIPWIEWRQYFSLKQRDALFEDKDIYGFHTWNALSKSEVVSFNKTTLYTVAAMKFCPTVVKAVRNKM